jgi:DNA-binding NtrC family response regulator
MRPIFGTYHLSGSNESRWSLLIHIESSELRCRIFDAMRTVSGVRIQEVESLRELDSLLDLASNNIGNAAAVLCASQPPTAAQLATIRALKRQSLFVLCIVDQDQTSLQSRCQLLLAGAMVLVDTRSECFAQNLHAILVGECENAGRREGERRILRQLMQRAGFVGESPAVLSLFRSLHKVSHLSDLSVLISGESGTGKELIATAIHVLDPKRSRKPFVPINCAALPKQISESELFGHCRGAFTGADQERKGVFWSAEGGVLLLDEIGELDLEMQAKLLRVLQTHRVRRVGADHEIAIDVRIVAATNRNLDQMVAEGTFREDLLHRLNLIHLHVPSLRDRAEDLKPLLLHFVEKHSMLWQQKDADKDKVKPTIDHDFMAALQNARFPGNVRQLENIVCAALIEWEGSGPLTLRHLPENIWKQISETNPPRDNPPPEIKNLPLELRAVEYLQHHDWNLAEAVHDLESAMVRGAMTASGGNQSEAARLLGITPRSVYNKLHRMPQS